MSQKLHQTIASNVNKWRDNGYESPGYPAISEILDSQTDAETGARRFLRQAQIHALETYWYLRLKADTPRIYLSMDNRFILDKPLQETYGESTSHLDNTVRDTRSAVLNLCKYNLPPLVATQSIRTV